MTATANYSGDPADSDLDYVRDRIGDIDSSSFILLDAEIQSEIDANSNLLIAAANCADKCVTRLGEYTELAILFQKRGDALRAESNRASYAVSVPTSIGRINDHHHYTHRNGFRW
jgi:hypothetical protein